VLRQVDHSVAALNRAVPASARELDAYEALLGDLERRGVCTRSVEDLPDGEEFERRRRAGAGLIRPELAVVLAFAKADLGAALEASVLAEDPAVLDAVRSYFPSRILARFDDLLGRHRLYRQLVATDVAGDAIDQMGPVWVHETAAELGRPLVDVAVAYWAARQVLGAGELLDEIEREAAALGADAEAALHAGLTEAIGRLARRYLFQGPVSVSTCLARDGELTRDLLARAQDAAADGAGTSPLGVARSAAELRVSGAPPVLALAVASRLAAVDVADAQLVSESTGATPVAALAGLAAVDANGGARLLDVLRRVEAPGRWAAWQRRALLDDVARWRAHAVAAALRPGDGADATSPASVVAAVEAWLAPRRSVLGGVDGLLDRLEGVQRGDAGERRGVDTVALASVAVRRLPS
jgi:glutamate dehydrogenase